MLQNFCLFSQMLLFRYKFFLGIVCLFGCGAVACRNNCENCDNENNICLKCANEWEGVSCDIPAGCLHQTMESATCDYYTRCLYAQQPCTSVAYIMEAKCREYADLACHFSPQGQEWAAGVTSCIQNKLSDGILLPHGSNFTCSMVDNVFFSEHVDCYLHATRHSFCVLPVWDQMLVVATGASMILQPSTFWVTLISAVELLQACSLGESWVPSMNTLRQQLNMDKPKEL